MTCGSDCAELERDPRHCGNCERECAEHAVCEAGECVCPPPRIVCGEACVDLTSDADHCGACGAACPHAFGCFDALCRRMQRVTCADVLVDVEVWGRPGRGLDLRPYTRSTLHWLGCTADGCTPDDFYCEDTVTTLAFGSRALMLRAVVDRGDAAGDAMPQQPAGCATREDPLGKYNGPHLDADPPELDSISALCRTLGYSRGVLVREELNYCPKPRALNLHGTRWGSDLAQSSGAGAEYLCTLEDSVAAQP